MSRGRVSRRGGGRAGGGVGVLAWVVPPGLVDGVVAGVRERRLRWLPSRFGVYFVLGLCLFSYLPYGQVVRELTAGLEAGLAAAGWQVPASTALTGGRRRGGGGALGALGGGGGRGRGSRCSGGCARRCRRGGRSGRICAGCWRWPGPGPRSTCRTRRRARPRSAGRAPGGNRPAAGRVVPRSRS